MYILDAYVDIKMDSLQTVWKILVLDYFSKGVCFQPTLLKGISSCLSYVPKKDGLASML
jgi:hypothetical protein